MSKLAGHLGTNKRPTPSNREAYVDPPFVSRELHRGYLGLIGGQARYLELSVLCVGPGCLPRSFLAPGNLAGTLVLNSTKKQVQLLPAQFNKSIPGPGAGKLC